MPRFLLIFLTWLSQSAAIGRNKPSLAWEAAGADRAVRFAQGGGQPKRTIRVGRRRRDEPAGPGGRPQAPTPRRQRPTPAPPPSWGGAEEPSGTSGGFPTGGGFPGGGGGFPTGGGGLGGLLGGLLGGGGGRGCLSGTGLIILLVICGVIALFFFLRGGLGGLGGTLSGAPEPQVQEPTQDVASQGEGGLLGQPEIPEATSVPFQMPGARPTLPAGASAGTAGGDTWTVMLYQDADDKVLEQDIYVDLNEAERVGSGDGVNIVAQVDRYRAGYQGDGDWTAARRYFITQDQDLSRVGSELVEELGEVNMADAATLVDFVSWAVENYPADKYALILSDHGLGWPGGWSDPTSGGSGERLPLAQALGDQLYLMEIDEALDRARQQTGVEKFELLGMDACLMSHLEVFSALAPHARYAVASQETEPSLGWAYAGFLEDLRANPGMSGADLGQAIVATYIEEDQRIVDDAARAEFTGRGSILGGLFSGGPSAAQVADQLSKTITLTAADLGGIPALLGSLNDFAFILQGLDQRAVAQARSYAQSYTNIFGKDFPPPYVDLGNFAQHVAQASQVPDIEGSAAQLVEAIDALVVAEKHGSGRPGSTGVSIYFPNSKLYSTPAAGPQSYNVAAGRFAGQSLWDDFLAFHYTGRQFAAAGGQVAEPEPQAVQPPAPGDIQVTNLSLSSDVASAGQPVLISADISGENIGYIKLLVGFYDEQANSLYVADSDYLEGPDTREVGGVFYPEWGRGAFSLEFEWEPVVFGISDGQNLEVALFNPESYGQTFEEAVYTVEGIYTFADDGEQRYARLYFQNGFLTQVFGFSGASEGAGVPSSAADEALGAPWEITPSQGDTFTILDTWYDLDSRGNVDEVVHQEGGTLTFGEQPFEWEQLDAAPGEYVVGFLVEDLDGNASAVYETVQVQ